MWQLVIATLWERPIYRWFVVFFLVVIWFICQNAVVNSYVKLPRAVSASALVLQVKLQQEWATARTASIERAIATTTTTMKTRWANYRVQWVSYVHKWISQAPSASSMSTASAQDTPTHSAPKSSGRMVWRLEGLQPPHLKQPEE